MNPRPLGPEPSPAMVPQSAAPGKDRETKGAESLGMPRFSTLLLYHTRSENASKTRGKIQRTDGICALFVRQIASGWQE